MKIGLISDTHGFLDPRVAEIFAGVDHILHAGDVGPHSLLLELEAIAPVTAVLGNTDMGIELKLTEVVELDGKKFLIHHIVDPYALSDELKKQVRFAKPDVIIYGHTHKKFYGRSNGVVYLNPGYSGRPKHAQERTVAILDTATPELTVEFFNL
ncbi:MAG: metallophosphoesterase [Verrucomicrobia bacterium]|nr:MAG: metallophosphoesterase [Verrucomicrobiota bacterium]